MNAIPPTFRAAEAPPGNGGADPALAPRWQAVLEAAGVVAMLAGREPEPLNDTVRGLPGRLARAETWRRERARHAIADLAAVLEPGIAALLAVNARGADPRPAAGALWREFASARDAILALVPEERARERFPV